MMILKVNKQKFKKNFYSVLLEDGNRISMSDEIMVKYGIRAGEEFDDAAFAEIVMDAQRAQAMDNALRLLGMQPRSRKELSDALTRKKFVPAVREKVLERIAELGYLNDETFARERALNLTRQGKGPDLIRFDLQQKGIAKELISEILTGIGEQPALETLQPIIELARKRFDRMKDLEPREAAQKLTGFLARRGYSLETVRTILKELRAEQRSDDDQGETHA